MSSDEKHHFLERLSEFDSFRLTTQELYELLGKRRKEIMTLEAALSGRLYRATQLEQENARLCLLLRDCQHLLQDPEIEAVPRREMVERIQSVLQEK